MAFKEIILFFVSSLIIQQSFGEVLKCENEGCYEVIKTFVKLLEEKINETDKILAEAQMELNEVTSGTDETFQKKVLDLDNRLSKLIIEMNTGIDGGPNTLFDLVNSVFKSVNQAEINANQIEIALDDGNKIIKIAETEFSDLDELVKKVQAEFQKLKNQTEIDLPTALQDAFDTSEKFHTDTKDLRDVLDNMKIVLTEYERNLLDAKDLTEQTLEKLAETSKNMDETSNDQKVIEKMLKDASDTKLSGDEIEHVKNLIEDASTKAKTVYDDSLELLNEVTLLELYGKFDDIKKKIEELENYSQTAEVDLRKFSNENAEFFDNVETTLDTADELQKRAFDQQNQIKDLLQQIKDIEKVTQKALDDKDEIIANAQNIYKTLEDFNMKVEEARENARIASEKIPEILKKIIESKKIVKDLEESVEKNMEMAIKTKDQCSAAQKEMDEVLLQSNTVRENVQAVLKELEAIDSLMLELNKINEDNTKRHDGLKRAENETEDFIQNVKEKVEKTRTKGQGVDENVDEALKSLQELMNQIDRMKDIDMKSLEDFDNKINELEDSIKATELHEKYENAKKHRQQQIELMQRYLIELAELEHQVKTIKKNADSLENRCFKRTRLEP